jgi:hypothetical protein
VKGELPRTRVTWGSGIDEVTEGSGSDEVAGGRELEEVNGGSDIGSIKSGSDNDNVQSGEEVDPFARVKKWRLVSEFFRVSITEDSSERSAHRVRHTSFALNGLHWTRVSG